MKTKACERVPGLIAAVLIFLSACSSKPEDFNVVLITLDTTRNDHVDTGNGARAYTPELKRFAQKAVVFERAYCVIPQTLPSHLSMLTSYYPHELGVYSNQYQYDGRYELLQEQLKNKGYQTAGIVSLGTLAGDTGFRNGFDQFLENLDGDKVFFSTARKITDNAIRLLDQLKQNKFFLFLHYSDPHSPYAPPSANKNFTLYLNNNPVVSFNAYQGSILRQTVSLPRGTHRLRFEVEGEGKDFDAFVLRRLVFSKNCVVKFQNIVYSDAHYNGSHLIKKQEGKTVDEKMVGEVQVTCSSEGSMKLFQVIPLLTRKAAIDFYRQEVEYMDQQLGRFLRTLENDGLLKKTIVIITADHGEGLGERGRYFGHVRYLNRQFIEVPLLMHFPGQKHKRIAAPVSQIGISPTVQQFLGFPEDENITNKSLLKMIKSPNLPGKPVYSFAFKPSAVDHKLSVISGSYQCIFFNAEESRPSTSQLESGVVKEFYNFDLSQSYAKTDEYSAAVLLRNAGRIFQFFQKDFHRWSTAFKTRYLVKMRRNEKEIERLKSIGYLQ